MYHDDDGRTGLPPPCVNELEPVVSYLARVKCRAAFEGVFATRAVTPRRERDVRIGEWLHESQEGERKDGKLGGLVKQKTVGDVPGPSSRVAFAALRVLERIAAASTLRPITLVAPESSRSIFLLRCMRPVLIESRMVADARPNQTFRGDRGSTVSVVLQARREVNGVDIEQRPLRLLTWRGGVLSRPLELRAALLASCVPRL
ncbi:hypothetical protein EVG20_g11099 [Dentipellis fragilis]|uniref:Uncharacterized protein n=1 Tax=Dentipellis fragilis TaxID=205917 RepID=A0A4Y9XPU5_9AGAM|nr:hypothetical protein EVG20_g11099 [Dentipellis fragilis]